MKTSRAILVVLASLVGGIGIRLAFAMSGGSGKVSGPQPSKQEVASAPRPAETEMLAAQGGARLRLLVAWLPGAGEDELLRAADAFAKSASRQSALESDDLSIRLLMWRWAELNPRAMLEWTRKNSEGPFSPSFSVNHAITAWAQVDFDSAWAAAAGGSVFPDARGGALAGLVITDPDKCLRMLRETPALFSSADYGELGQIMAGLTARDPAAAAAVLARLPLEPRKYFADPFALAWAKLAPAAAVAWMSGQESVIRDRGLSESGQWIVAHAPEHLPALLENLPAGRRRAVLQAAAFAQLAASDAAAARRQLEAMPATPARQYCRVLLMKALCESGDDAGATALASQLDWTVREEWCPSYAESRYGKDLAGSAIFHTGEKEPALKAMQRLLGRIAARNRPQAAALLAGCSPHVAKDLLSGDPAAHPAAMADLLLEAGDPVSKEYLDILADIWMRHDPVAASSWAAAHDPYLFSFVERWSRDPLAAFDWLVTQPAKTRAPWIHEIIARWNRTGVAGLHAAIRSSSLPDAEKQELLTRLLPP